MTALFAIGIPPSSHFIYIPVILVVGVVADSDLEAEYHESVLKARALVQAAEEAVRYANDSNWTAGNTRR